MSTGKLGQLISSLTKNEKAYFKRWLPNTKKENRYVQVFNKIDKQPSVTLHELSVQLGKGYSSKQLKNISSHLWSSLLLSLRDYHRNNDIQLNFHGRSDSIKVLRSKGMLDEALKATRKLLADCEEIEMFPEALRAIEHVENILAVQQVVGKHGNFDWKEFYKKKERISLLIAESSQVRSIERQLKTINDNLGFQIDNEEYEVLLTQLKQQLDKLNITEESSFDARFRYYSVQATIASVRRDFVAVKSWFEKVLTLLDENEIITERYFKVFHIVALHNYAQSLFVLRELDPIPAIIEQMRSLQGRVPELVSRDFYTCGTCTLNYYNLKEDYEQGIEEWNKLYEESSVQNHSHFLNDYVKFMLQGTVVCFWNRDYVQSLSVLRSTLREADSLEWNEDLILLKTLEILCNYELGDEDHTEHLISSFNRKLEKKKLNVEAESALVKTVLNQLRKKKDPSLTWVKLIEYYESAGSTFANKLIRFDMSKYAKEKARSAN